MRYLPRDQWPTLFGIALGALLVLVGAVAGDDLLHFEGDLLGVAYDYWGIAITMIALGLATQIVVNNRAALRRERHLVRTAAQLREVSAELDRLARTDALTGIANRRAFFDVLGIEFRRSKRYGRDLSVLMLDLDHFKQVNDRWGHPFGDHVLKRTAEIIAANVRESDIIGRYGGEEFGVALPETSPQQAIAVAEKLRLAVEEVEFRTADLPPALDPPVRITISVGVASLPIADDQDEVELIGRADQALYEAKRTGRNRVTVYTKASLVRPEGLSAG